MFVRRNGTLHLSGTRDDLAQANVSWWAPSPAGSKLYCFLLDLVISNIDVHLRTRTTAVDGEEHRRPTHNFCCQDGEPWDRQDGAFLHSTVEAMLPNWLIAEAFRRLSVQSAFTLSF